MNEVCSNIIEKLFEPEERRLRISLDAIIDDHRTLSHREEMGILYNGYQFSHSKNRLLGRYPMLAWDLNDRMDAYLKDRKSIERDKATLGQILYRITSYCMEGAMFRNYMPDCLVHMIPNLENTPRTVPIEALIQHDDRLLRQYTKYLPLMQFYATTYLIY